MNSRIIIADDHPLMLRGISDFITSKGYNIIASAENGEAAYNLIVKHKPDIAILDISMPILSGLDVAQLCKNNFIDTKIILITFDNEEHLFDLAQEYGVFGYILKEFAIEELENCILSVCNGVPYFTEEMTNYLESKNEISPVINKLDKLTKTECKILLYIAQNNSSNDIASALSSSIRTIEKHRSNILKKLELEQNTNALTNWVMGQRNLILKYCSTN